MAGKQRRQAPVFGERLRQLRQHLGRRHSYEVVVRLLQERFGITSLTPSTLHRYERGRVPDAAALWGLAQLYQQKPDTLLRDLVEELTGQASEGTRDRTNAVLDDEELACLESFRALGPDDRRLMLLTLARLGGAPPGAEFRDEDWDGKTNRRSGVDRRKEDPKSAA